MYINKLKLKNYRNYKEAEINFDKGINIIYGDNAAGKTNILESIYLCSTSKSHKNSKEKEIINFDENEAHIKIFINNKEKQNVIDIQLNKESKKGIALNGLKIDKLSEFLGTLKVVMFAPEDLNIIKDGPSVRRKFLDMELCQIDKIYVSLLSNYNKILNQRNVLLKDIYYNNANKSELLIMLDALDEQLVKYGMDVIEKRKKNIDEIKQKITDIHYKISDSKEKLIIEYEKCDFSLDKLKETRNEDIKNQYTKIGPHRDDISFKIEGNDIRKFGSQGQKKTAAISLKLSELIFIKEKNNDSPILLLDDVFSELDETRQKLLVESIKEVQTIITCTGIKKNIYELLKPNKIFKVENGDVVENV